MSTVYDEKPTTGERYAAAIEASNLKVSSLTSGPVDVIIAAGWCGDTMGASLFRLRAEYDAVRADILVAGNDSLTDHLLILMRLKTLAPVKQRLWSLAQKQAEVVGFDRPEAAARAIVGKCLDVFLDPNCRPCEGRGFTGGGGRGYEGPQVICKRCKGTGKRSGEIGRDEHERSFAGRLLVLMEQSTNAAETGMAKKLLNRE